MNFSKEKASDLYELDTELENFFVVELMPTAPEQYLKVFIYAKMYSDCKHLIYDHEAINNEKIARHLGMTTQTIEDAWEYWENQGAIRRDNKRINGQEIENIEFLNLRKKVLPHIGETIETNPEAGTVESDFALDNVSLADSEHTEGPSEKTEGENLLTDEKVQKMLQHVEVIAGRTFSPAEVSEIISWNKDLGLDVEAIEFAFRYCNEKGKNGFRYITKVVEAWAVKHLLTMETINEYIAENDQKYYGYKRVMTALGFHRNPTEEEKRIMDNWFNDFEYSIEKVLEACSKTAGIPNPNFRYVNKVLQNWSKEAQKSGQDVNEVQNISQKTLNKYYSYIRKKAKEEAEKHRQEVYETLPEIKHIDDEIQKIGLRISRSMIMGAKAENADILSEKMEKLIENRAVTLAENNYEIDYTDVHYKCSKCRDTGMTDKGERCTCIDKRIQEAKIWAEKNAEN